MRQFCSFVLIFLFLSSAFASEPKYQSSKKERFKQYLAGIKYLEAAHNLSTEEKAAYYQKLVEITGFTAESANKYIERYKDNPQKWKKLIDSVIELINKPFEEKE